MAERSKASLQPDGPLPEIESLRKDIEQLDRSYDNGYSPYSDRFRFLRTRDPGSILLDYGTGAALAGRAERGFSSYQNVLDVIDYSNRLDIPLFYPADIGDELKKRLDEDEEEINGIVRSLREVGRPIEPEKVYDKVLEEETMREEDKYSRLLQSAAGQLEGQILLATTDREQGKMAEGIGILPASPLQISSGLELNLGERNTRYMNRVENIMDKYGDMRVDGWIPDPLWESPGENRNYESVVVDHSVIAAIAQKEVSESAWTKWENSVEAMDKAVENSEIEIYLPERWDEFFFPEFWKREMKWEFRSVAEEIPLPVNPEIRFEMDDGETPDDMAEDYFIAKRGNEMGKGDSLVMTYDSDFKEFDWVDAVCPEKAVDLI